MDAKQKILAAARAEFIENGFDATRMRSIAERADINKGLLHYYFKTKEALIVEVFQSTFSELFGTLAGIFESEAPIFEKIEQAVEGYIAFMMRQDRLPLFIISEMARDAANHERRLNKAGIKPPFHLFAKAIETAKARGEIRKDADSKSFILSLVSLTLFPFIGKSMLKFMMKMNDAEFKVLMQERKHQITDILIRSLAP